MRRAAASDSARTRTSAVQQEIRQTRPFRSSAQEATVALLRTASVVNRALARVIEPAGLSLAQYNALRIIRGAGEEGIATLAVRDRMIEQGTTITRLVGKLTQARLITRKRMRGDRREVRCYITPAGRRLLERLDPAVDAADEAVMRGLSVAEVTALIELLDRVRASNAERGAARHASAR